jgi:multidrug transporter EmrE-like cation transporter
MAKFIDHIYILATIFFTVYSQLVMRYQVLKAGPLPPDIFGKLSFVGQLFLNPWVLSSILATLLAGISWMLTMSRFEISYAYPWIGLNFVLMLLFGVFLFDESISITKVMGTLMVIAGVLVIAKG